MAGRARIIRVVMRLASRLDDEVVGDLIKRWGLIHNCGCLRCRRRRRRHRCRRNLELSIIHIYDRTRVSLHFARLTFRANCPIHFSNLQIREFFQSC